MIFDYFNHTYIISLPRHKDRVARLTGQLAGKVRKASLSVVEAIDGALLPAPAYWQQGNGAWGCLQSHVRLLQTIWQAGHSKALILEDDAIFDPSSADWLESFFSTIPQDWGQLYLGGAHQMNPEIKGGYFIGKSVNRTHAYAVQRAAIPKILQHICHAPDYMQNSYRHVDHQLEAAHQRADWKVICPEWWVFGQGENHSSINGNSHPDKWWDWASPDIIKELPWVIVTPKITDKKLGTYRKHLHFGWTLADDNRTDVGMQSGMKRRTRQALKQSMDAIAGEAWSMRRLPAVHCKDENQLAIFMEQISHNTVSLEDAAQFNTVQWAEGLV